MFDGYQRVFPHERRLRPVTIVLIEENSIARYGQWPWPRTRVAELIEKIAEHHPLAIGLDLVFPEPDRFSPGEVADQLPLLPANVAELLKSLPTNDQRLAKAVKGRDVVLGISAEFQPDPRFSRPPQAAPVSSSGGAPQLLRKYPSHIGNVPVVDEAAAGRGMMNSGPPDQVVRIVPLVADVQGVIVPSLGVETLRVALGARIDLVSVGDGLLSLRMGPARGTLQDDGQAWLRFSTHASDNAVAAAAVMAPGFNGDALRDHIVLVGVNALGLQDYKTTPLGEFIPGVNIHGQVIENLYNNVSLSRPEMAPRIEAAVLVLFGMVLILAVPRLTAMQSINLVLGMVVLLVGAGIIGFLHYQLLLDPAWPTLGTAAVFGTVVVGALAEGEKQRRALREDAAHMAGEVDAARRIQMGLLPDPEETLGHDRRFRLAALLEPARTVGGDFYDCFMVDSRRLFFVVADVSGKGLPAALFMASAKSHLKSAALREPDVGEVLTRAQDEIAHENPEQLFVTTFAAMLDVHAGTLEYANAGHDAPFVRRLDGRLERLGASDGPPLCVVEHFDYQAQHLQLAPGEWLCVVTDGATEAMNRAREFLGGERLRESLAAVPAGATPADVLRKLREDVKRFTAGAEPADDLTLLVLRWDGNAAG